MNIQKGKSSSNAWWSSKTIIKSQKVFPVQQKQKNLSANPTKKPDAVPIKNTSKKKYFIQPKSPQTTIRYHDADISNNDRYDRQYSYTDEHIHTNPSLSAIPIQEYWWTNTKQKQILSPQILWLYWLIKKLSRPDNVLFISVLLCSTSIMGYVMSSLVRMNVAKVSIPNSDQLVAYLWWTSSLASSVDWLVIEEPEWIQDTWAYMQGKSISWTLSWVVYETSVIYTGLSYEVEQLIINRYSNLWNNLFDHTSVVTPWLAKRSIYQRYFGTERVSMLRSLFKWWVWNMKDIYIIISNNKPSAVTYTVSYVWLPNNTIYVEQRRAELRYTPTGIRVSKIFCETKWCSRHPFYNHEFK